MRLVSYNRKTDCLYDNVIVWTQHTSSTYRIMASPINGNIDSDFVMGVYTSEEKMECELNRLHKGYDMMSMSVFQFRRDGEVKA